MFVFLTRCAARSACNIKVPREYFKSSTFESLSRYLMSDVDRFAQRLVDWQMYAPPRMLGDSSIPTDVGVTATTKLRVRRRSSWPAAAFEDAYPSKTSPWMCWNQPERFLFAAPVLASSSGAQANTKVSIFIINVTCLGLFVRSPRVLSVSFCKKCLVQAKCAFV